MRLVLSINIAHDYGVSWWGWSWGFDFFTKKHV